MAAHARVLASTHAVNKITRCNSHPRKCQYHEQIVARGSISELLRHQVDQPNQGSHPGAKRAAISKRSASQAVLKSHGQRRVSRRRLELHGIGRTRPTHGKGLLAARWHGWDKTWAAAASRRPHSSSQSSSPSPSAGHDRRLSASSRHEPAGRPDSCTRCGSEHWCRAMALPSGRLS